MIITSINCYPNNKEIESHCDKDCIQFRVLKIILEHDNDKTKKMLAQVVDKALGTNFNIVDSSGVTRHLREQHIKGITGFLAEYVMYLLLKKYNSQINPKNEKNVKIELDTSSTSKDQVDIRIIKNWVADKDGTIDELLQEVEVRSSFPFLPISTSICKTFDVLGPYVNETKTYEKEKDFYLRLLYSLEYQDKNNITYQDKHNQIRVNYNKTTVNTLLTDYFNEDYTLKKDLIIYFVGGATKEMMNNNSISYIGSMESSIFNTQNEGSFKKIKLKNALDAISILNLMLGVCQNEHVNRK